MKINGVIPIEKLEGKCATCKHFNPVIKELYGITTLHARGNCSINHTKHGNTYKQRTETCKKWEGIMDKNCCDCEQTYSDDVCECELFNKHEEAIRDIKLSIQPVCGGVSLELAIEALEKQIPKKAEYHHEADGNCALTICPNCENRVTVTRFAFPLDRYCKECGQRYVVDIANWEVKE